MTTLYPWQQSDWQAWVALRSKLPHALLLTGPAGIGKREFALTAAQWLLCETDGAQLPCGVCAACHWIGQGNHPDLLRVRPDAVAATEGQEAADDDAGAEPTDTDSKKTRAPSREIRIEQVRALVDFANVGAHRAGLRVAVIYPVEAMNHAAANALLKTLEEPPPNVVFLLVTDRVDQLLPTIVSRCRVFKLRPPDPAQALQWLTPQVADAQALLAASGGAPLAALRAAGADRAVADTLLPALAQGPAIDWLGCADALQKAALAEILAVLQRWAHDLLAYRLAQTIRYFPGQQKAIARCAALLDPVALSRYVRTLTGPRRTEHHPVVVRLAAEALLIDYQKLFAQPAGDDPSL